MRKSPKKVDPATQYATGLRHLELEAYSKARDCFQQGADQHHPDSIFALARLYEQGKGVTKDISKAADYYQQLNDKERYHKDAALYLLEIGKKNQALAKSPCSLGDLARKIACNSDKNYYREAVQWYKEAVDKDDDKARLSLSDLYATGKGVEQSFTKALEVLLPAVQSNLKESSSIDLILTQVAHRQEVIPANQWFQCGEVYAKKKEYQKAVCCYEKAGDHVDSLLATSRLQLNPELSKALRFSATAVDCLQRLLKLEPTHGAANYALGYLFEGHQGVTRANHKAMSYYEAALASGHADAGYWLGCFYYMHGDVGAKQQREANHHSRPPANPPKDSVPYVLKIAGSISDRLVIANPDRLHEI